MFLLYVLATMSSIAGSTESQTNISSVARLDGDILSEFLEIETQCEQLLKALKSDQKSNADQKFKLLSKHLSVLTEQLTTQVSNKIWIRGMDIVLFFSIFQPMVFGLFLGVKWFYIALKQSF